MRETGVGWMGTCPRCGESFDVGRKYVSTAIGDGEERGWIRVPRHVFCPDCRAPWRNNRRGGAPPGEEPEDVVTAMERHRRAWSRGLPPE